MMDKYQKLIDELIEQEYLATPRIIEAFRQTPRKYFLRPSHRMLDSLNTPLPIGAGQTISQPLTVAFMLHLLQPQPGDTVLDIGYGSGWQTAIIAQIVCPGTKDEPEKKCGMVHAYEIVTAVAKFGHSNIEKHFPERLTKAIRLYQEDYQKSYEKNAPYDKIISAAAFDETPADLIQRLAIGGRIVYPTQENDIRAVTRNSKEKFTEDVYPGFVFVPITH